MGFDSAEQTGAISILRAILTLGNLEHSFAVDRVTVTDNPDSQMVAKCLSCEQSDLFTAMTQRIMKVGGDQTIVWLSEAEFIDNRDALAKALFHGLFRRLVHRINQSLSADAGSFSTSIGILDIFGFEDFGKNSFEQFCINYANEKLHRQFLHYVFELEEAEYKAEGIEYSSVKFTGKYTTLFPVPIVTSLYFSLTHVAATCRQRTVRADD